jgi:ankyrin repeat protein
LELVKLIPEHISTTLQGGDFRAASQWLAELDAQPYRTAFDRCLVHAPRQLEDSFMRDLDQPQSENNSDAVHFRRQISTMLVALQESEIPPEDLRLAVAALRERSLAPGTAIKIPEVVDLMRGHAFAIPDEIGAIRVKRQLRRYSYPLEYEQEGHSNLVQACVRYLAIKLPKLPLCGAESSIASYWDEPFLRYAVTYWGVHLRRAGPKLGSHIVEEVLKLLLDRSLVNSYIMAAWISNLMTESPLPWDVNSGVRASHICAWFGLSSIIQRICDYGQVDDREDRFGQTPLMYACRKGHKDTADLLLQLGANPAVFSDRGRNALFEAVRSQVEDSKDQTGILNVLLQDPRVNINETDPRSKGRTALHLAVLESNRNVVYQLLNAGADPNCSDFKGFTPLMYAARDRKMEVVDTLLQNGARADAIGSNCPFRTTALHLVVEGFQNCEKPKPEEIAIMKDLCKHGADFGARDAWGLDVGMKLEKKQVDLEPCEFWGSKDGNHPTINQEGYPSVFSSPSPNLVLHAAVSRCNLRDVENLLRSEPQLAHAIDEQGRTALHLAVDNCNQHMNRKPDNFDRLAIISALVPCSRPAERDVWGFDAIDYSLYNRDPSSMIELLEGGECLDPQRHEDLELLVAEAYRLQKPRAVRTLLQLGADELWSYSLYLHNLEPATCLADLRRCTVEAERPSGAFKEEVVLKIE